MTRHPFKGITANVCEDQPGTALTLDRLRAAMRAIGDIRPAPVLASYSLLQSDKALTWTEGRQDYAVAHPAFWAQLPTKEPERGLENIAWLQMQVIDLDLPSNHELRINVFGSMARVMGATRPLDPSNQAAKSPDC